MNLDWCDFFVFVIQCLNIESRIANSLTYQASVGAGFDRDMNSSSIRKPSSVVTGVSGLCGLIKFSQTLEALSHEVILLVAMIVIILSNLV